VGVSEAREQLARCIDAGVNLFDTANVYSLGRSETVLGEALGKRRDDVLIATKVRLPMSDDVNDRGLSRRHVIAECEASLRRLDTDYIDLYQLHEWDGLTPVDETLSALDSLVQAGKIRYIGVSNFSGWHVMKYLAAATVRGLPKMVSHQLYYSLQAREAEYELLPIALDQGLGVLVYSPLAGGLLSGKYRRGVTPPAGSRHMGQWSEPPVRDQESLHDIVEVIVRIADARGLTPSQVALAYTLAKPTITSLVLGARDNAQLESNLIAATVELTLEEIDELDLISRLPPIYPYWHQSAKSDGRLSAADLVLLRQFVDPTTLRSGQG
jgi:aryl-alcohol dehydrogenase-like predicted oxidoreductase